MFVVKIDPLENDTIGTLEGLESGPMHLLLFQSPYRALDHRVLFGAVNCDEVLLDALVANQRRPAAAVEG